MDETDIALIAALRRNARAPISDLAAELGVSRATVRARLDRLIGSGDIAGFTVVLKSDLAEEPVRAIVMVAVEGNGTEDVVRRLRGLPELRALHTTNGRWDLVAEIAAPNLPAFDDTLRRIRLVRGIAATETNLLLSTRARVGAVRR